jgi:hypothetical protein
MDFRQVYENAYLLSALSADRFDKTICYTVFAYTSILFHLLSEKKKAYFLSIITWLDYLLVYIAIRWQ